MNKLQSTVQYKVTSNGNTIHTEDGKIGVTKFKSLVETEHKTDATAKVTCERLVDGVSDGKGDIMRYSNKSATVVLPQGRYHREDRVSQSMIKQPN